MDEPSRKFVALTSDERRQLESWAAGLGVSRALAMRARIALSCTAGSSDREVARLLRLTPRTVGKWRTRFAARRLAGLLDAPRSGAPRSISDGVVEAVLTMTLHEMPAGAPRWSSRRLAAAVGVSQSTVLRIWRAFGL
jgi:transposase